mgnify:CR=1 FL=1
MPKLSFDITTKYLSLDDEVIGGLSKVKQLSIVGDKPFYGTLVFSYKTSKIRYRSLEEANKALANIDHSFEQVEISWESD